MIVCYIIHKLNIYVLVLFLEDYIKMKKRVLVFLLSLLMLATMVPANVFASNEPDYFCITNTSNEDGTVTWIENGVDQTLDLELLYKVDGQSEWSVLKITQSEGEWNVSQKFDINLASGQSVYFKANTDSDDEIIVFNKGSNIEKNSRYYVNCDKNFNVSGDITTLISKNGNILDLTDYEYVFYGLFLDAQNLISAKDLKLPSTVLSKYCYGLIFNGCTNLIEAPILQAETMVESCYDGMFYDCTSLVNAPALPAMNLADSCYRDMFEKCTNLKNAPALPAINLAESCYYNMFSESGLEIAPELPATTMVYNCYDCMFAFCPELRVAPKLPATDLADYCYYEMFWDCTSLTSAPALPATILKEGCYGEMFKGCTGLTTSPILPANDISSNECYTGMFDGCTNLERIVFSGNQFDGEWWGKTFNWVNGVKDEGVFITSTVDASKGFGPHYIPKDTDHKWLLQSPITVTVNQTEGYKVLYSAPKTDGTAEENEKANAQHTVLGIPDGNGNTNYVFSSNETVYLIPESGFVITSVKVGSNIVNPTNGVYSFTPTDGLEVEIYYGVEKPQEDRTSFVYTGSELTYSIPSSDKYAVSGNKQTNVGTHRVTISLKDGYSWLDGTGNDLEYDFIILPSNSKTSGKITTGSVNTNTEVKDVNLKAITENEAKTIVNVDVNLSNLKQAINGGKDLFIYTEVEEPSNENKSTFISMNITEDNAVILEINLYGEIVGEENSKKRITDTNGYKARVSITLTQDIAAKINIADNRDYFVLRSHDGVIERIPATSTIDANNNYVFTFETDKFSTYAIYSMEKPVPTPTPEPEPALEPERKSPNTGLNDILTLSTISILSLGAYVFTRKKKANR